MKKNIATLILAIAVGGWTSAQTFTQYTTTEQAPWQMKGKVKVKSLPLTGYSLQDNGQWSMVNGKPFRAWGTCFNELDLDAISLLTKEEQEKIMHDIFAPDGDLKFTRGRLTMNANDYSRAWYSCDTVAGDFALKYFNIEHDKENVIRLIKMAQKWQPAMTFWVSPWSPPSWMKINQDYCVASSPFNTQPKEKDYLLFDDGGQPDPNEMQFMDGQRGRLFPRRLATQNYFIQEPRYLQAYANMFCKFIDLYAAENIPIDMVMYQNEAYSYTPYPGCAWTAEGTLRFNKEYLIPTLRQKHPEVEICIGTLNTNRLDYVKQFIDGLTTQSSMVNGQSSMVNGIGLQWEGRDIIDSLHHRYPDLHLISSESECGNGQMDWRAGEHTFFLLHEYIGRGCDEYYNWNFILCDQGRSAWGWNQNALVQVRSANRTYRYTPEYYAYKHFSHFVEPGSTLLAFYPQKDGIQAIVFQRPDGKRVIICGNKNDEEKALSLPVNGQLSMVNSKYLNVTLAPHSFNTFVEK